MAILQVSNVSKYFGDFLLFKDVNFAINEKDRIALIGPNGCGKSTLLKIILGIEEISSNLMNEPIGKVAINKGLTIGYLSQDVISDVNHTLLEEALEVFTFQIAREKELEKISNEIANNPHDSILQKEYARKLELFESNGGYDYHYTIEMILLKFGFTKEEFNRKITSFSGGERTKMAFAKLLLLKPDLLVLDEPTNHLDISTIEWLESYLKSYTGAILFVSHDRYFINEIAGKILELENKILTSYKGNYDLYLEEKRRNYELEVKKYNAQQKEIERLKRFIEYFKPKPRFVSRAKDREKKLEHMKLIDKPYENNSKLRINFNNHGLKGKKILEFSNCKFGYDSPLFDEINFTLFSDDHLAIMGDNGCGKTTILRSLLGQIPLLNGSINQLRVISIGYLAQNDFSLDDCTQSIMEYIQFYFPDMSNTSVRTHLGKFGFVEDDVFKQVNILSGGEKMRLLLARLVLNNYDLLLLDEPTNHLDLVAKEALLSALENYAGALILVSHDRYFVDALANKIIYIANKKVLIGEGNYESIKDKITVEPEKEITKKEKVAPQLVKRSHTLSKNKCEEKLANLEQKLSSLKEEQFKEENYMDSLKMKEIENKLNEIQKQYDELLDYYISNYDN